MLTISILIIIIILILIGAGFLTIYFRNKNIKWSCIENKCEKQIGGDHTTREKCLEFCGKKEETLSSFAEEPELSYNCNSMNSQCYPVSGKNGTYTSMEKCLINCNEPVTSFYYPQTLFRPTYPIRRFRPWGRPTWRRGGRGGGRRAQLR